MSEIRLIKASSISALLGVAVLYIACHTEINSIPLMPGLCAIITFFTTMPAIYMLLGKQEAEK